MGCFIHTNNQTLAFWEVTAGSTVAEHEHPHEQIVTVRKGQFQLTVNDEIKILDAGMIVVIPGQYETFGHYCKRLQTALHILPRKGRL